MEVSKIPMNKKKVLALLLTCCMLVGMIPAALAAEEEPPISLTEPTETETTETGTTETPDATAPLEESNEPEETQYVAQIGETKYEDFAKALSEAKDGETLQLLDDVTLSSAVTIGTKEEEGEGTAQIFTLDLNGKTATVSAMISIRYGSKLTITDSGTGGKITTTASDRLFSIWGDQTYSDGAKPDAENAITSTLKLESGAIESSNASNINLFGNGATFHMTGGSVTNSYKNSNTDGNFAIAGNGTRKSGQDCGGIRIIIEGGTVTSEQDCAIYLPGYHDTTISGGTIEGWSGIEIDSGNLTRSGDATIKSTYESDGTRKYKEKGDGNYNFGAALAIVSKGAGNESKTGYYGHMNVKITGGTFVGGGYYAVDEYNLPHVQDSSKENTGYFGDEGLIISGGTFTGGKDKGGILSDTCTEFITGGTFSGDPGKYVVNTHYAALEDGSYIVKKGAPAFSATIDTRGNSSISASAFKAVSGEDNTYEATVTGTMDLRTYIVSDKILQADFASLLAKTREAVVATAAEETTIPNLYVKAGLDLVFADIDFLDPDGKALATNTEYTIKQVNPGMAYAYPEDDNLKDGVKESTKNVSEELSKDGMTFILADSTKTTAIGDVASGDVVIEISYKDKAATTFIIHNEIKFSESEAPGTDAPVVEVQPEVKEENGTKSATATVDNSAVTNEKVTAAAGAEDKTLTIDAGSSVSDVDKVELTLSKEVVSSLAADSAKDVTTEIKTPVGTVALPAEAMKQIKTDAGESAVKLVVEKVADDALPTGTAAAFVVEVKKSDDGKVTVAGLKNSLITLSFDVGAGREDEHPALYYVNENDALETIESRYDNDTGILTAKTSHLSTYALVTLPVADGGLGKEITVTAAKDHYVTVQVSNGTANAIYSVKVAEKSGGTGEVVISAPNGSTVTIWETDGKPTFNTGTGAITSTVVKTQTVTLN